MKIDRMMSIFTLLLQHGQMTAPQLAERMEVSRRTITRDIDALCRAGIPIVTRQGGGGGISIAEGYRLDKSLLSREDLENILAGLRGLHSVGGDPGLAGLLDKLLPGSTPIRDSVQINLASFYKNSLSQKIGLLREAVRQARLIRFDYYSPGGRKTREAEPYLVVYQWSDWYLMAYCRLRKDYRLFKLGRLWNLTLLEDCFHPREVPAQKLDLNAHLTDDQPLKLLFHPDAEYLLVEEYGPNSYSRRKDGYLLYQGGFSNKQYLLRWVLGFGSLVEVLEPLDLRMQVAKEVHRTGQYYSRG